jgi:hypothetical protein
MIRWSCQNDGITVFSLEDDMCEDCTAGAWEVARAAEEALDEIRDFVFDPLNVRNSAYSEIRTILRDYSEMHGRDY